MTAATPVEGDSFGEGATEDASLITGLKSRDPVAYERLIRIHGPSLFRVARRMMRSEEDARDALQDTFLSVLRSIDGFGGGSLLTTWLHRITINVCLMKLRSSRRRPEEEIDRLLPEFREDGHHLVRVFPWSESAESMLERAEARALVRQAIDQLSDTHREVLLLRDIEELSVDETARLLDISANAVKVRLHRARQALRKLLDPYMKGVGS